MNGYIGSIDTDAGIGTILSNFSTDYIKHVIEDSLLIKFRPFDGPMPNMVDVLQRQFLAIKDHAPDYIEKVTDVRLETYKEIIELICNFYNLEFVGDFDSINPEEIYGIVHILYDIFIANFTTYMINFFVSYIINNASGIATYLQHDENANKPKEFNSKTYINPDFAIIHPNINKVIYNMAGYDVSLNILLEYFLDPALVERISSLFIDKGDIYKKHYAIYILDQRYSASLLTAVKLALQAKTQEINNV